MISVSAKNDIDFKTASCLAQGLSDAGFGKFKGSPYWSYYIPLISNKFYNDWDKSDKDCIELFYRNYDLRVLSHIKDEKSWNKLLKKWFFIKVDYVDLSEEELKILIHLYTYAYARTIEDVESKFQDRLTVNRHFEFQIERLENEKSNRRINIALNSLEQTNKRLADENSQTQHIVILLAVVSVLTPVLIYIHSEFFAYKGLFFWLSSLLFT